MLAGAAGILFAVLSVSRVAYSGELDLPTWEATPAEITEYYTDLSFDAAFAIAMGAVCVGYALFLVFMAKAVSVLVPPRAAHRWVATWAFAFAALDVMLVFAFIGLAGALRQLSELGITDPASYAALHTAYFGLYWVDLILQPFWLAPVGYLVFRSRLFPRWLGAAMVATAVVQPVVFFLPPEAWDVTGLTYLWVAVAGAFMAWRPAQYEVSAG